MSIYKVNRGDVESFSVVTHPIRHYVSSSTQGVTGSVHVFARRSDIEKEMTPLSSFQEATHGDADLASSLRSVQQAGKMARLVPSSNLSGTLNRMLDEYLDKVTLQQASARKQKALDVIRFTPSVSFTSNTLRKAFVKDVLNRYYRTAYPSAHWAYSNYHSLNFFTSSTVPTSSVLLYPNIEGGPVHENYVSGVYVPSGSFSFDFYVNPRYQTDNPNGSFKAGTLLHLSSTFAVSLVTGSRKDENGRPVGFRIQLQLSHSADIPPSQLLAVGNQATAASGWGRSNLVFLSDDNSLLWNRWQHVVIRWGTNLINQGTGSFNIDGTDKGTFVVPSSTIAPLSFIAGGNSEPDVLCVGNYFEGLNNGTGSMSYFFAADPALRDGLQQLEADVAIETPNRFAFNHPFKGEVHDVAIKRFYMGDLDISTSASVGPKAIGPSDEIAFYLPPFFVEESPFRQFVGLDGGILQTPFFEVDGTTNDPFNVALSFGVAGHYINIENFLRDFASDVFPRVHHMTGVTIKTTTDVARPANDFLYDQPYVRRRNLLIMPCDDGLFVPSFELLASESRRTTAVDDLGVEELSFIHLDNIVSTASLLFHTDFGGDSSFIDQTVGVSPETPGKAPGPAYLNYMSNVDKAVASGTFDPGIQDGAPLTIFQRTRDPSSNQVTFFDISNLFYGKRILPGTFVISDPGLSGSGGAISLTLKDDGLGNIYRADCLTSASTWNSVGNIYYDEGLVVIKSPHLYFFGKEGYEISFRGEQRVHVMKIDVTAPSNQLNSSSNPNYKNVPPSTFPNDPDKEFVYITGINLHDDNLNVIMKTQLAQPIIKRTGDRIAFHIKVDF